jgi:hypothetical protein
MDNNIFLNDFIEKIKNIRDEEFKLFNIIYTDKIIEKKILNENTTEFNNFKVVLKKKALLDKFKPSNVGKKEYESKNDIDILQDDIFNNNNVEDDEDEIKLDINLLDKEKKLELIYDFLQRKNIILDEIENQKIESIINNPDIILKKYINISKMYRHITKIGFIKKLENGSYIIDLNENKTKKSKNHFFKN